MAFTKKSKTYRGKQKPHIKKTLGCAFMKRFKLKNEAKNKDESQHII